MPTKTVAMPCLPAMEKPAPHTVRKVPPCVEPLDACTALMRTAGGTMDVNCAWPAATRRARSREDRIFVRLHTRGKPGAERPERNGG